MGLIGAGSIRRGGKQRAFRPQLVHIAHAAQQADAVEVLQDLDGAFAAKAGGVAELGGLHLAGMGGGNLAHQGGGVVDGGGRVVQVFDDLVQFAAPGQARQRAANDGFGFLCVLGQIACPGAFKAGVGQRRLHLLGDARFRGRQLRAVRGQVHKGAVQHQLPDRRHARQQRLPQRQGQARCGQAAQAGAVGAQFIGLAVVKALQGGQRGGAECFCLCSAQRLPIGRQSLF